jgi:hypothetical protein
MSDKVPITDVAGGSAAKGRMLPGVAGIAIFLLVVTLINVMAVLRGVAGAGTPRYGVLSLCTLLLAGLYGLLRMRRWGHAIVLAGCLLLSAGYFYVYARTHVSPWLVEGLFALVFFLYLVRPEVRDRMI